MTMNREAEIEQILTLQLQIEQKLKRLSFDDPEARGNIVHHLPETAVFGKRLSFEILPAFLTLSAENRQEIGELVVDLQYELSELRQVLEDMEPALIKLMNFLTE